VGALTFKEVIPECKWVVQSQPSCAHGHELIFPCTHVTVTKTVYTLQQVVKIKRQELTLQTLEFSRMYVYWREREHEDIDFLV
jgi:hypothetical protein